jgi:hypothetical protein
MHSPMITKQSAVVEYYEANGARMRRIIAVAFLLMVCFSVLAQGCSTEPATEECRLSGVYRKDGWEIPGLVNATESKRMPLSYKRNGVEQPMPPGLSVTVLKPSKAESYLFSQTKCQPPKSQDPPEGYQKPIKVLKLWRFDVGGRVFAYGLEYEPQSVERGARVDTLCFGTVMFMDTDGSGRFTIMKQWRSLYTPVEVPNWAKRLN